MVRIKVLWAAALALPLAAVACAPAGMSQPAASQPSSTAPASSTDKSTPAQSEGSDFDRMSKQGY